MGKTKIEWATHTWNPLRVRTENGWSFGCQKISPGCLNCYAGRMNKRLFGGKDYTYTDAPTGFYLDQQVLEQPLHWRKPRTVFVCSMCDLFHENVGMGKQLMVLSWMMEAKQHRFMVLTKRPDIMRQLFQTAMENDKTSWPADNVWLGVTAENQEEANRRIPILLSIPAAHRFVSIEPMLGPVDLSTSWHDYLRGWDTDTVDDGDGYPMPEQAQTEKLDLVIVGGESGPGARPMHPDWARSVRDQCQAAGVPFFFKQWGEWAEVPKRESGFGRIVRSGDMEIAPDGTLASVTSVPGLTGRTGCTIMRRVGKKRAGRLLDGLEHNGKE